MDLNSIISAPGGGGAVACPVCTLYLREGISLQKHLDTHPKEQVIEALIRASSGVGSSVGAPAPVPSYPQSSTALNNPQIHQAQHPVQAAPSTQPVPQPQPQTAAPTTNPHLPHAPSPYPISSIYECPPINAMIPPPQFASFSYQQFVNNGTMMIPAQYAMAQAPPPQASQMMQMVYSPYGMYHQQQLPTVQMISAPPIMPPAPPAATAPPTTLSRIATRPPNQSEVAPGAPVSAPVPTPTTTSTSSNTLPVPVLPNTAPSPQPQTDPLGDTGHMIVRETRPQLKHIVMREVLPQPEHVVMREVESQSEHMVVPEVESQPEHMVVPEVESQPEHMVVPVVEPQPEHMVVPEVEPQPEHILPDMEMPTSPEPASSPLDEQHSQIQQHEQQGSYTPPRQELDEQQQREVTQSECSQQDQSHTDQYSREDPPPMVGNDVADDDKTERILPDIEDSGEIESLLVRCSGSSDNSKLEIPEGSAVQVSTESVKERTDSVVDERGPTELVGESIATARPQESHEESAEETLVGEKQTANESSEPQDLSMEESQNASDKPEIEQLSQMLVSMDTSCNDDESLTVPEQATDDKTGEEVHESISIEPSEKPMDEDESTTTSSSKVPTEPIECKIIVEHEESDASSVASLNSVQCDLEIQNIIDSTYKYKYSQSAPSSPVDKKKYNRSLTRTSLRSDFGRSNDNLCPYPVGFEATTLQDYLKDNYNDEDMELEEPEHQSFVKQSNGASVNRSRSRSSMSACLSGLSTLKVQRNKMTSPESYHSNSTYGHMDDDDEEVDADSCSSYRSRARDEEEDEDEDEEDGNENEIPTDAPFHRSSTKEEHDEKVSLKCETVLSTESLQDQSQEQSTGTAFQPQNILSEHYASTQFPIMQHHHSHHSNLHPSISQSISGTVPHEMYTVSSGANRTTQNSIGVCESADQFLNLQDSKNFSTSIKSNTQKHPAELLNINEDAHPGPINVFEFDGLQILGPSTFISESSQKAVSGTSQQSILSNNNSHSTGNDEEVKSVNMRADESMPPRGELSEQESNGCTEQSAWQLYMGQESSRMSTSYDLMARESWEESEGSEHEDNNAGPLLDSRSLATHFTSSLFLDRERKTPTRNMFKCSYCPEVFDCPKERRVHSRMVHKEITPPNYSNDASEQQQAELKLLEGRTNMFDEMFLQPAQHPSSAKGIDGEPKLLISDALHHLSSVVDVVCNLCNQHFSSEKSLQMHNRRMHVAEPIKRMRENTKCQICNEEFASVASFNLHLKVHPLECGQCGKYFYRKQNFKLHMKRHLGIKPFPCSLCDKAFLTKQKLDEHTNGHTGNAPVKCNLCNETFRRYSNLTQHKNRHHLNIKKKLKDYICHCGEVFHTKKKLAWHKETHDEKPKACTYCNERFIHMASLTRHMRRAHNRRFVPDAQRENENVECPICKCIYLRSSLAVHMRVHNGERPYECQVCSKAFSTKWNLQLHKWTHAARSTKPFKCSQCSAAFYRHSDYTAHMNSHRNVRPYTCNYCGAQFIRKYNCLRHVKEHEENKAYTCDICNKTFHRSYYLKEHLRVHSGARPYTCHICGKSSSTKSNHNKHVRIHHAREPVNTEN
ncbi:hypothetical protein QAD02_010545 [Eretmocerus hayati]|uniref:Uncharacterized protein n=1 Tax=Eretmocerus hayati TaxID=131215 RepID=A0ACC2NUJ0_9HYME|nr:hypothetical protein QAD02_010545 [Eretmocerus hayati]